MTECTFIKKIVLKTIFLKDIQIRLFQTQYWTLRFLIGAFATIGFIQWITQNAFNENCHNDNGNAEKNVNYVPIKAYENLNLNHKPVWKYVLSPVLLQK